jgi:hypothetical protein
VVALVAPTFTGAPQSEHRVGCTKQELRVRAAGGLPDGSDWDPNFPARVSDPVPHLRESVLRLTGQRAWWIKAGAHHRALRKPAAGRDLNSGIALQSIHQSLEPLCGKLLECRLQVVECHRISSIVLRMVSIAAARVR